VSIPFQTAFSQTLASLFLVCTIARGEERTNESGEALPVVSEPLPELEDTANTEPELRFMVRQFRVRGAKNLPPAAVEKAVYPFVGPGRTLEDLEQARAALEKAYRDEGYQTVAVEIPQQNGTRGIIYMDAVENKVGRLRVRGARYFQPSRILKSVPSLAEGGVPDFDQVQKEIVAVNAWPDRRVTPVLRPGVEPGTVDVDLNVEDEFPLHGSVELNNRYSPDTTELRLNTALSYDNLWQLGHSVGGALQIAPERPEDALVYSAYYIARFASAPEWSVMLNGTKQDSDVSTLGGAAVAGRGQILGLRVNRTLPGGDGFYHSLSTGFDWKQFDEDVVVGEQSFSTPIEYYPFNLSYNASWDGKKTFTTLGASVNLHTRGLGSDVFEFDAKRFEADGKYIFLRGDLSHTHDLPGGFQAFLKIQGQATADALVNSEQFAGGGQGTVRGYLESETLGDKGYFGTLEVRTPSLLQKWVPPEERNNNPKHEWRFHAFVDGGRVVLNKPLPAQKTSFDLASVGVGTRLLAWEHWNGAVDVAWPLEDQSYTTAGDPFLSFRLWADF
jgi:hemolysin activation/secretion protein